VPARRPTAPAVALLVRHGRTPTTGKVLPGRAQAQSAATRIGALATAPVAVYASPLERAAETAKPIAAALGLRVRTEKGLLECDFGDWTGKSLRVLARRREWRTVQLLPGSFRFPGGESFVEMQMRMVQTIDRLADRHRGATFVAVSHADPIKAAVAATAGVPLDLFQRLVVSPCSVTALVRGENANHVLCVNNTSSLTELALS
jgi:broad specificity phosphatase PhoE